MISSSQSTYRADIDGLRAVAVLSVLFFHAEIGFPGGYVGVDIFFVISGFLITRLIIKDLQGGKFSILEFWERRARRILPALSVVIFFCLAAGWLLFFPLDLKALGKSVIAQSMLASNVFFWLDSAYFASEAHTKPLLHTWSLAVEEQFYIFFPAFPFVFRKLSQLRLSQAIACVGLLSLALSIYCSYYHERANFYLLPTRSWELLVGALIAASSMPRQFSKWSMELLSWSGLLAILFAVFSYDGDTRFPGAAAVLPCLGAGALIFANNNATTSVGKMLAARPLVFIGLISYSLYLWHWPLLVFVKYYRLGTIPMGERIAILVMCFVVATLSWKFVETPFRKRVFFKGRQQIRVFAIVTTALLCIVGVMLNLNQGFPSRIPAEAQAYAEGETDFTFIHEVSLQQGLAGDFLDLGDSEQRTPLKLFVWGDSHAKAVIPVLDTLCREFSVRGVAATHSATAPLIGYESKTPFSLQKDSIPFNKAVVEYIRNKRVSHVIIAAAWGGLLNETGSSRLRRGLVETIDALKGTGAKIWVMKQVPQHHVNVPRALASAVFHGHDPLDYELPLAEHRKAHQTQDEIFTGISGAEVAFLDPTELFVTQGNKCMIAKLGKALYRDDHHLSITGAMLLRPLFEPIFAEMRNG